MNKLIKLIKKVNFIWIAGNGGSAATAEHFATDLVKKGYRAVSLCSNSSLITMLANDYGYTQIFSRQLEVFGRRNDLLITISCSGTSKNIVDAKNRANTIGMKIYEFEVFSKDRDFQKLEDKHLIFAHEVVKAL